MENGKVILLPTRASIGRVAGTEVDEFNLRFIKIPNSNSAFHY
jgi:hypothetical protein